jgi:hypothetical protein
MNRLNKLLLAFTLLGSSLAAHADDTSNFAGLTLGQTSDKIKKSHALNDNLGHPDASGVIGKDTTGCAPRSAKLARSLLRHLRQRVRFAQWH